FPDDGPGKKSGAGKGGQAGDPPLRIDGATLGMPTKGAPPGESPEPILAPNDDSKAKPPVRSPNSADIPINFDSAKPEPLPLPKPIDEAKSGSTPPLVVPGDNSKPAPSKPKDDDKSTGTPPLLIPPDAPPSPAPPSPKAKDDKKKNDVPPIVIPIPDGK